MIISSYVDKPRAKLEENKKKYCDTNKVSERVYITTNSSVGASNSTLVSRPADNPNPGAIVSAGSIFSDTSSHNNCSDHSQVSNSTESSDSNCTLMDSDTD